jgi:hypothetical protein
MITFNDIMLTCAPGSVNLWADPAVQNFDGSGSKGFPLSEKARRQPGQRTWESAIAGFGKIFA